MRFLLLRFLAALLGLGLLILVACRIDGAPTTTSNATVKVETLFDVDGYRMYRFEDGGRTVYFVLPATSERRTATTAWTENCGKDCTREMQVTTGLR